jgi:hypothetical protein
MNSFVVSIGSYLNPLYALAMTRVARIGPVSWA